MAKWEQTCQWKMIMCDNLSSDIIVSKYYGCLCMQLNIPPITKTYTLIWTLKAVKTKRK